MFKTAQTKASTTCIQRIEILASQWQRTWMTLSQQHLLKKEGKV